MANNRLYLKCVSCGGTIMLGKHFGGELHRAWKVDEHDFTDALNEFYTYALNAVTKHRANLSTA